MITYDHQESVTTPCAAHCSPHPAYSRLSVAANAQEKPKPAAAGEELQEVVVTGSRIARPDLDRLEPTMIITAATFDDRGYLDVGQALSENPAFSV